MKNVINITIDNPIEPYQNELTSLVRNYVSSYYPEGAYAIFSRRNIDGDTRLTICIVNERFRLSNYW